MTTDTEKVILERINHIQETINVIDRDLAQDRKDIQEFTIRLGAIEDQIKELRKGQDAQTNKIQDRVAEVVQPLAENTQNLGQIIEKKRIKILRESFSVRKWLRFWERG